MGHSLDTHLEVHKSVNLIAMSNGKCYNFEKGDCECRFRKIKDETFAMRKDYYKGLTLPRNVCRHVDEALICLGIHFL